MSEYEKLACTMTPAGVEISVKVVPGAARERVVGMLGDALKVAVAAPPEGGKANQAVAALLAGVLGVRPAAVMIVSGQSSPRKRVRVSGLSSADILARLRASGN